MMYSSTKMINEVTVAITNFCNAGCPQCHRTNPNGLDTVDWLPSVSWTLDEFKNAYSPKTLSNINIIEFCGTWGDPAMAKDLFWMCEYIMDNSDCKIEILTNGSIRDEQFWWDLGVMCGQRLEVIFAVDGSTQEMHSHYRRKTDLKKILKNMSALSQTFSKVTTMTVVFKHNEKYLDDIKKLVSKHGATKSTFIHTDRGSSEFIDEFGYKQKLEESNVNLM